MYLNNDPKKIEYRTDRYTCVIHFIHITAYSNTVLKWNNCFCFKIGGLVLLKIIYRLVRILQRHKKLTKRAYITNYLFHFMHKRCPILTMIEWQKNNNPKTNQTTITKCLKELGFYWQNIMPIKMQYTSIEKPVYCVLRSQVGNYVLKIKTGSKYGLILQNR